MADALCGPSNALQSFQKHTQVDRTLQQDRLTHRQPSHENFRSRSLTPNPQTEAEFEAFQQGLPAGSAGPSFLPHPSASLQHARPLQPAGLPAWAADFQQLNIHDARQSPIPAAHFKHEAPLHRSSPAPWQTEFMRQEKATTSNATQHSQSPLLPSFGQPSYMGMNSMSGFGQMSGMGVPLQGSAQNTSAMQTDQFDDEAFAAAFDNAAAMFEQPVQSDKGKMKEEQGNPTHMPSQYPDRSDLGKRQERYRVEQRQEQGPGQATDNSVESFDLSKACVDPPEAFDYISTDELAENALTGDSMLDSTMEQRSDVNPFYSSEMNEVPDNNFAPQSIMQEEPLQSDQELVDANGEADELSRTAGQLLDNLKHEQSDKFAKSNFMTLMRQLRDKEVRVDGENFVEVSEAQEPDHGSRGEFSARVWE